MPDLKKKILNFEIMRSREVFHTSPNYAGPNIQLILFAVKN